MKALRLDKYLSDLGRGTRSQVKDFIRQGRVTVNGTVVKAADRKVMPGTDVVALDGMTLDYEEFEYYMLNKPAGCVSATEDPRDPTVVGLITGSSRRDLFPVGRLDKDTEGLLLITNDGELAHRLLSPKHHVPKTYLARIDGPVTQDHIRLFQEGVNIGEERPALPADLRILKSAEHDALVELTICEGKFHQVKRMFEAVGRTVVYLKRLSMGSLLLDQDLKPGEYRNLTEEERNRLLCYKK
ncbi:pseudouridine synthase [Diplocloster modestus]|uniref:Pseudouridine synthase n=1 Tax=Diplocloster modestus TaxID=2850322 RepID=A0ABS6K9C6_9FIRM|nr:pseudouridine synthase [Diplocloster modestus]MBU9727116.1 rRNA pseudouridine synthase [Diplocloster modestus]